MRKGYTVMEMLLVIVILGMLLGIGVPVFRSSIANNELNLAARQLATDIKYARQLAMIKGNSYLIYDAPPPGAAHGYSISETTSATNAVKKVALPNSVSWTWVSGSSPVTFNQNGTVAAISIRLQSTVTNRMKTVQTNTNGMVTLQ